MSFKVTILGCGSALPTTLRNQSAQIVHIDEREYLVDCGEGTQLMMRKQKMKLQKINQIFISHLHGDHYLGLYGYLSSLHLLGREKPMSIYGPPGLREIFEVHARYSKSQFKYPLEFIELQDEFTECIFENNQIQVFNLPLKHKIFCNGYVFKEKRKPRKMIKEKIEQFKIPLKKIKDIKAGESFNTAEGLIIPNEELTLDAPAPKSYAYCSDTAFVPALADAIQGIDLLYHESTFVESDLERAVETKHSTAKQAAEIARRAGVGKLLLGHYSARYTELDELLKEAQSIFPNSVLAEDGMTIEI